MRRRMTREHGDKSIGAMLAAAQPKYTAGWLITEHVRDLGGTPESTVIGRAFKSSCVNAALAGGTLGYYCDIEAHHVEAILHGPAAVVPSAMPPSLHGGPDPTAR